MGWEGHAAVDAVGWRGWGHGGGYSRDKQRGRSGTRMAETHNAAGERRKKKRRAAQRARKRVKGGGTWGDNVKTATTKMGARLQ